MRRGALAALAGLLVSSPRPAPAVPGGGWRQVLAAPRIGGRLTAVAVDPEHPSHLYVGTEEGTLVRSLDDGATWDELAVTPAVIATRSSGIHRVPSPDAAGASSAALAPSAGVPDGLDAAGLEALGLASPFFQLAPDGLSMELEAGEGRDELDVLADVTGGREAANPVRAVALCPGARARLVVVTPQVLYGSEDDGVSFVPLYAAVGSAELHAVACAERPAGTALALATNLGVFVSRDGGRSFDEASSDWPVDGSRAVAYLPAGKLGEPVLHAAIGEWLYVATGELLRDVYPSFDHPETAPWDEITWITRGRSGALWIATESGLRFSPDGRHWSSFEDTPLGAEPLLQVVAGVGDGGREEVVALGPRWAYATGDGGRSWAPFFLGPTRRSLRQLATTPPTHLRPARWWLVSSGELWLREGAVVPPAAPTSPETAEWAAARLRARRPLGEVLAVALEEQHLSPERIAALEDRSRLRAWAPRLDLVTSFGDAAWRAAERAGGTGPFERSAREDGVRFELAVFATWSLADGVATPESLGASRGSLYELRHQLAFAVEDAWHERDLHLRALSRGDETAAAIEVRRARIDCLEAALATWTRGETH